MKRGFFVFFSLCRQALSCMWYYCSYVLDLLILLLVVNVNIVACDRVSQFVFACFSLTI